LAAIGHNHAERGAFCNQEVSGAAAEKFRGGCLRAKTSFVWTLMARQLASR
jgi:hypothetical protein